MKWIWWQPLVGIGIAAWIAALLLFNGHVPRELLIVLFVITLVVGGKLLRNKP